MPGAVCSTSRASLSRALAAATAPAGGVRRAARPPGGRRLRAPPPASVPAPTWCHGHALRRRYAWRMTRWRRSSARQRCAEAPVAVGCRKGCTVLPPPLTTPAAASPRPPAWCSRCHHPGHSVLRTMRCAADPSTQPPIPCPIPAMPQLLRAEAEKLQESGAQTEAWHQVQAPPTAQLHAQGRAAAAPSAAPIGLCRVTATAPPSRLACCADAGCTRRLRPLPLPHPLHTCTRLCLPLPYPPFPWAARGAR
jgi:hypothetical protein